MPSTLEENRNHPESKLINKTPHNNNSTLLHHPKQTDNSNPSIMTQGSILQMPVEPTTPSKYGVPSVEQSP